jgi:uncharacterized protein
LTLPTSPGFYSVAALAVIILGLGKGGFAGLGSAAMPLMALVIDPVRGAAILLPMMLVQDVVGVWAFRKDVDRPTLLWSIPGGLAGTILGWWLAASVSVSGVQAVVGGLAILFGINRLLDWRGKGLKLQSDLPQWTCIVASTAAGFASQIALAGGPPYQIWAMTKRFSRDIFVGTCAVFYFLLNWFKVPAFFALGQFTWPNFQITLLLMPLAIASTFAGVRLVKRVPHEKFGAIISALMVAVGLRLLWVALL